MPNRAARALHVQHDRCVNKNSMLLWHVSIDSVWLFQSCLQFHTYIGAQEAMQRKEILCACNG